MSKRARSNKTAYHRLGRFRKVAQERKTWFPSNVTLALLKAEGRFAALPVAASREVKLGGTMATVGFPNIGLQGFAPVFNRRKQRKQRIISDRLFANQVIRLCCLRY